VFVWGDEAEPQRGLKLGGLRLAYDRRLVAHDPSNQLFLSITGGGSFSWTTVQLAQAYARLLTGAPISPRLTAAPSGPRDGGVAGDGSSGRLLLDGKGWTAITNGMHRVIAQGTAAASMSSWTTGWGLGRGVYVFGKTGTPRLIALTDKDQGNAASNAKIFVLAVARTRSGAAPTGPRDICGLRLAVVNIQYGTPTGDKIIYDMVMHEVAVRDWLTAPCAAKGA
jgi:hypothetical protein